MAEEIDWDAAYQEYLPRVYNFFCYHVSDQSLAEDLTASTFEKAWRGRSRFRRDLGAFSTWLFTIARNVATDHFRRKNRELPLEAASKQADPASTEETVQQNQDFVQLVSILSAFPARERELVAFKYGAGNRWNGMSKMDCLFTGQMARSLICFGLLILLSPLKI